MKYTRPSSTPFHRAGEELREGIVEKEIPQVRSPSYQLAFVDHNFLLRDDLRPVRLQLELLKTELTFLDEHIESTIVVFGSARIVEPKIAKEEVALAKRLSTARPNDQDLKYKVSIAEKILEKSIYYVEARKLGKIISEESQSKGDSSRYVIMTGGGPGIMEASNRGAHDVNKKSIGLNILLPLEQGPNPYITPELSFQFHYFAIRKMHFLIRAKALIAFPGGYGTLDELFEALTLLQTGKMKPIPVLLFGKKYWSEVINFQVMVDEGTISPEDLSLFQFVETAEEAWQIIKDFYRNQQ